MIHARPLLATNSCSLLWLPRRSLVISLLALLTFILIIINLLPTQSDQGQEYLFKNGTVSGDSSIDLLEIRIKDLERIKNSLRNELRIIERGKYKLLEEHNILKSKSDKLVSQISRSKAHLRQLDLDILSQRKRNSEQSCDISVRNSPILFSPLRSQDIDNFLYDDSHSPSRVPNHEGSREKRDSSKYSFDFSSCSLANGFKFYVPPQDKNFQNHEDFLVDPIIINEILTKHHQFTRDIDQACLLVMISNFSRSTDHTDTNRNTLTLNLIKSESSIGTQRKPHSAIATPSINNDGFNYFIDDFDFIIPRVWNHPDRYDSLIESIPPQSAPNRKYLAAYLGFLDHEKEKHKVQNQPAANAHVTLSYEEILRTIHRNSVDDSFLFIFSCQDEMAKCLEERQSFIEMSVFFIIIPKRNWSTIDHLDLLYLSLLKGAIPVIVGGDRIRLPFDEVIDWRRVALLLNRARLTELHFILRTYSASDIYQLKYHGRRVFENYLATSKQIVETILSFVSLNRFGFPLPPTANAKTNLYLPDSSIILDTDCSAQACRATLNDSSIASFVLQPEILGPREKPLPSQVFSRNYSLVMNSRYDLWNHPMLNPFELYPSHPLDPVLPAEYQFVDPNSKFRPIADGLGGSGVEFARDLGGDYPNEQFTIILLTYDRQSLLMKTLERLKGLPYLNKVLIVWNGINRPPAPDLVWPEIGSPIELVKVNHNSLNNRFIPFETIQTDAILSLDDDTPLRADEIIFAFRVWRESRDRIVGFPGRFHAWDANQGSWLYNSNHSCQLSMVLTGGAFLHRFYLYQYSYRMPESIRLIVDKLMNCEDIAMNFLVAHLTRKPPIKVTSRWTFHCASCQSSLSQEESHFRERHECLNSFASVYGYMPLLNTQHRSDSVLFKTRVPRDKQKCFKYV